MSIQTVTGGTLPTPIIEWVVQGVTRDESYTHEYTHSMILNATQIATLRPGRLATYGMSGHTITDIGRPVYLWPDAYRVSVTTIARPEGYENPLFVTAQFLPWYRTVESPADALALLRDSRPFTAETDGREVITFLTVDNSPLLAAPNPALPTFRGQPVKNYGTVYSQTGAFLGRTVPEIPPREIVVDRRIDKWRPGWNRITTVWARRPSNV